jgi:hypothetical protein
MVFTPDDKQWIAELLDEKLERLDRVVSERIERLDGAVSERIERVETKLLTAFQDWSQPVNLRMRSHSADLRSLQMDVEALQDRVSKLEDKNQ